MAYRDSGRRICVLAPAADEAALRRLELELQAELAMGPAVRLGSASWLPGDSGDELVERARRALRGAPSVT